MTNILLVDDDLELSGLLSEYLAGEGFAVQSAGDGQTGLQLAQSGAFDLVILDLMLPKKSGFEALTELRRTSRVPVIVLTARGDEVDRVLGLELGADDYVAKPFSSRELAARIRAIARRTREEPALDAKPWMIDELEIDPGARQVSRAGKDLGLTGTEFVLCESLARRAGEIVGRDELVRHVLGRDAAPGDRSLDVHVSNLRRKLGPAPGGGERIKTVRSSGYFYVRSGGRT